MDGEASDDDDDGLEKGRVLSIDCADVVVGSVDCHLLIARSRSEDLVTTRRPVY
jgi:hypothetical protein